MAASAASAKTRRARLPRPVRLLILAAGVVALGYILYSWLYGYERIFRDSLTGQLVQVRVRNGPIDALKNIGELFPEFLRGALPMLVQMMFFFFIIIFQFIGLFWFLSRGQSYTIYPGEYDVGFDDVRGQPAIVDATKEVVKLFEGFKDFRKMGGYPPHGILFEGPPGTGKTLLGKAIAGQTNVPFLYTNGTSLNSMFWGVGNMRIASMFRKARRLSKDYDGAVIFIDELDAVAGSRGAVSASRSPYEDEAPTPRFFMNAGMGGMNSMLVNELLVQMDGLVLPKRRFRHVRRMLHRKPKVPNYNLLIIGATNRAAVLDPALLRPGRFDRKIHVGIPGAEGRKDIIKYYVDKVKHESIDLDKVAGITMGYSPARIKNLVNEGLIFALRDGRDAVTYDDLWQAKLTDEIGLKQPVTYSPWEKEATAIHEAGHAVARWFLTPYRPPAVITIQKREDALGLVHHMDVEERLSQTRDEFLAEIKVFVAGMVAEQVWYGQTTSGTAHDLAVASMFATNMVARYGMGPSLLSADAIPPPAYGGEALSGLLASGPVRAEAEKVLDQCRQDVTDLLQRKAHCVEALRDRLLVDEQLTGEQFDQLMHMLGENRDGEAAPVRRPPRALGSLRPLPPAPANGEAAGNGDVHPQPGTNGDQGTIRPSSPWARPPGEPGL